MQIAAAIIAVLAIMSSGQIASVLTSQATRGATPATLRNIGFELFYQHGFNKRAMAENLAAGYSSADGVSAEQNRALKQAARFWQRELKYWEDDVTPDSAAEGNPNPHARPFIPGFRNPAGGVGLTPTPRPY